MRLLYAAVTCATVLCATAAFAAQHPSSMASQDYMTGSLGYNNILEQGDDKKSAQFGAEYRFREWDLGVRPTLGVTVDSRWASYVFGGINWEIPIISDSLYIIPNFMAGIYSRGHGHNQGGAINFRSGLELDYQLPNTHRVGISFNHMSNANIYDRNPGSETLLVNYSIPVSAIRW
jgi:opacity protein-like surface antigen